MHTNTACSRMFRLDKHRNFAGQHVYHPRRSVPGFGPRAKSVRRPSSGAGSLLEIERGACFGRCASRSATAACCPGSGTAVLVSSPRVVLSAFGFGNATTTDSFPVTVPVSESAPSTGFASDKLSAGQSFRGFANTSSLSASESGFPGRDARSFPVGGNCSAQRPPRPPLSRQAGGAPPSAPTSRAACRARS